VIKDHQWLSALQHLSVLSPVLVLVLVFLPQPLTVGQGLRKRARRHAAPSGKDARVGPAETGQNQCPGTGATTESAT
jgi:hypothetical protein